VLAHELRNPLAPIRTSLAVLETAAPGGAEARAAQAVIERQIAHMSRLVDDLLDVNRITRGKLALKREIVDLAVLVERTVDDYRAVLEGRGLRIERRIVAGPMWVDADPARLVQTLTNLLSNAEKFTPAGGRVTVTLAAEGANVVLRVRDTGVGIEPDLQEHLFEPFVQATQEMDRGEGGLGLGLAMVKGLIELHGGTVEVSSGGAGQGAQISVKLPRTTAPALAPAVAEAPPVLARRVLIVDDNIDFVDSLRALLTLRGHDVEAAYQGASALEVARGFQPEIVLCDLGLPKMDGYAVARAFRADPILRPAYLVALSGYVRPDIGPRLTQAGFDAELAKPPDTATLERILREAPSRRRADNGQPRRARTAKPPPRQ
jgi:two-component system CheB/CheR fusion protein